MDSQLMELRDALRTRLDVVGDRTLYEKDPKAHLDQLVAASTRVDELSRVLAPTADPMLRHYLERQSFVKALDWLNEQDT